MTALHEPTLEARKRFLGESILNLSYEIQQHHSEIHRIDMQLREIHDRSDADLQAFLNEKEAPGWLVV